MKQFKNGLLILFVSFTVFTYSSCKSKTEESSDVPVTTDAKVDSPTTVTPPAPVVIANDDVLKQGVTDAIKDYPKVKADVSDSTINLSGEIKRADWQKLAPTLNSLHPKRVNSAALTIK